MAIKLVRHAGTITVSTMGDDAAHSLDCGLMGKGQALRVNEFGGQDVFIKVLIQIQQLLSLQQTDYILEQTPLYS